jgi:hypothetical protein
MKFSFCPTEKHSGELWAKLQERDLEEPCEIVEIHYEWSRDIVMEWWHKDTFEDFTQKDIDELIGKFNKGLVNVPGIVLTLDHTDGEFTTFRTWTIEKDKYYQNLMDDNEKLRITTPLNPRQVT